MTVVCARWDGAEPEGIETRVLGERGATNHARMAHFAAALGRAHAEAESPYLLGFDRLPGLDAYFAADVCFVARVRRTRSSFHRLTPRYRTFARLEASVFAPTSRTSIFVLAPEVEHTYREVYGTPAARFVRLPPGVASERYAPADAAGVRARTRALHGIGDDALVLLFMGSDFLQKGLDRVLAGVASLPEDLRRRVRLLVAGSGDVRRFEAAARARGLADTTTLLGGTDDVPALLQGADLLVHPARVENAGAVLVEALAAGLPVLCSGECGYASHVGSAGAGTVLETPFEQRGFDTALRTLLEGDRSALRERALAYAESVDLSGMHATIVHTIEGADKTDDVDKAVHGADFV